MRWGPRPTRDWTPPQVSELPPHVARRTSRASSSRRIACAELPVALPVCTATPGHTRPHRTVGSHYLSPSAYISHRGASHLALLASFVFLLWFVSPLLSAPLKFL